MPFHFNRAAAFLPRPGPPGSTRFMSASCLLNHDVHDNHRTTLAKGHPGPTRGRLHVGLWRPSPGPVMMTAGQVRARLGNSPQARARSCSSLTVGTSLRCAPWCLTPSLPRLRLEQNPQESRDFIFYLGGGGVFVGTLIRVRPMHVACARTMTQQ